MRVEVLPRLGGRPVVAEGQLVVVYADDGTPLMVCGKYGRDQYLTAHTHDEDFQQILTNLGIRQTVIATELPLQYGPPAGARRIVVPG